MQFQAEHGRPPTPVEALHLAQQATLETRDNEHEPRSLAEQRTAWTNEASAVLGSRSAVASMVATALTPAAETPRMADAHWVAQTADRVLAAMEETRPTWQMCQSAPKPNARSAPSTCPGNLPRPWSTCWSMRCSIAAVLPSPHHRTASKNRARCGGSTGRRFTPSPAPTFTPPSAFLRPATPRHRRRHPRWNGPRPHRRRSCPAGNGRERHRAGPGASLPGPAMCTSGARLQLAIAPAGAGKTTAMRALTLAWTEDGGQVIGLAPSAAAAAVLGEQTGIRTDTLAKLTWSLRTANSRSAAVGGRTGDVDHHRRGRHGRHPLA